MRRCIGGVVVVALAMSTAACGDDEGAPGPAATSTTVGGGGGADGGGGAGAGGGQGGEGAGAGPGACSGFPEGALAFEVNEETSCYWLVATQTPQIQANDACEAGGHLATIASADENAHVEAVASGTFPIWIGLRCDALPPTTCIFDWSNNYEWMTGEPFGDYENWADGEPSEARGVGMLEGGQWAGFESLNNPLAYVCEAVLVP